MTRPQTVTGGREATTGVIPGRWALSVGHPGTKTASGFQWVRLTDVARLESGHTPSRRHPEYWDGDIPWIGIRDATSNHGRVIYSTNQSINQKGVDNSSARVLPAGTVCLSRTASVGYVVTMGTPMATSQDFVNWVCGPDLIPRYLHYILVCEQDSIRRFAHGSVHPTVYYPEAKAFHVCIPNIKEQAAIVEALGALDDKIAVNDRIAATCHALAETITSNVLAESPTKPLEDLAIITMGSSPPGDTYNNLEVGIPFYQGTRDFGDRFPSRRVWCSAPVRTAQPGDTLLSVRAPVGRLNIAVEQCCIGRGLAALSSKNATPSTLFHSLSINPTAWLPFESEGTVFGSINKKQLASIRLPFVDGIAGRRLEERLASLDRRVKSASTENRTLSTLRDTLLPKLMSGEIRVRDAEKVVEDAA